MKAIVINELGEPDVMQLRDISELTPGPNQIVVEIKAAGVNPVDTYIRAGNYSAKSELPYTPGFDGAGTIRAVGDEINNCGVGDRVFVAGSISGTYAQEALCFSHQVFPLPEKFSFEQGAAIGIPYATAYRALFSKAQAVANDTVLIHGSSGGVGVAAVQLAKAAKMKVIGSAGSEKGFKLVQEQGANYVVNHKKKGYLQEILDITAGRGVDIVIEMLANVNLGEDVKILAKDGKIVVVGCRGPVMINPRDAMIREASIIGMIIMNISTDEKTKIFNALAQGFQTGQLNPVAKKQFPLSDAALAHAEILNPGACGKIVLIP